MKLATKSRTPATIVPIIIGVPWPKCRSCNLAVPGEFEPEMEGLATWFRARGRRRSDGERAEARKRAHRLTTCTSTSAVPATDAG